MSFVKLAAEIWRDFVTDGVPSSGVWKVVKADMRAWMGVVEETTGEVEALKHAAFGGL